MSRLVNLINRLSLVNISSYCIKHGLVHRQLRNIGNVKHSNISNVQYSSITKRHVLYYFIDGVDHCQVFRSICNTAVMSSRERHDIHLSQDNSYSSFDHHDVASGGYPQCFSLCDNTSACQAFTFVGIDVGTCYLKSGIGSYIPTTGSNYITCSRVSEHATNLTNGTSTSHTSGRSSNIGAIAGGVVGGLAALLLLILLILLLRRRRREKVKELKASTHHKELMGPVEAGSAASRGDIFAPYGGYYQGMTQANGHNKEDVQASETMPFMAAAALRHHNERPGQEGARPAYTEDAVPHLDGRAIYSSNDLPKPDHSRQRFVAEMPDNSVPHRGTIISPISEETDSPTLGRDSHYSGDGNLTMLRSQSDDLSRRFRNGQHVLSWNNYNASNAVSPPSSMSSGVWPKHDGVSPDVSPELANGLWTNARRATLGDSGLTAHDRTRDEGHHTGRDSLIVSPLSPARMS
ncbi:hypothetical protein LTR50_003122 [Elasticomyces elasticus]|nr:hypothetical protein LTR50_003122 [Elasticomyces elasticus]